MELKANLIKIKDYINAQDKPLELLEQEAFIINGVLISDIDQIVKEYIRLREELKVNSFDHLKTYNWFKTVLNDLNKYGSNLNDDTINTLKRVIVYLDAELGIIPSFYTTFDKMIKNNEFNPSFLKLKSKNTCKDIYNHYERLVKLEKTGKNTLTWEEMYILSSNYYNNYKNLNVPTNFKTFDGVKYDANGYSLGTWLGKQRTKYFENKLTETQIQMLLDLDMNFNHKIKYQKNS